MRLLANDLGPDLRPFFRRLFGSTSAVGAVVFDFDDTLTDDSTTALLKSVGIDPAEFWGVKAAKLLEEGWDPTPAYLKLLLDNVGQGKPLGKLSNSALRAFGKTLKFYPGLPGLFKDLRELAREHVLSNPAIEFYIISGGLEEIIRGSCIAPYMSGIWGCKFAEKNGQIAHIKNVVSFTEKTKYLYTINKGLHDTTNPYAVNERRDPGDRRVPFTNMIYLGDGLTDVPCFSLLDHFRRKGVRRVRFKENRCGQKSLGGPPGSETGRVDECA